MDYLDSFPGIMVKIQWIKTQLQFVEECALLILAYKNNNTNNINNNNNLFTKIMKFLDYL